jgi:type II secretory pathway component PulM
MTIARPFPARIAELEDALGRARQLLGEMDKEIGKLRAENERLKGELAGVIERNSATHQALAIQQLKVALGVPAKLETLAKGQTESQ